MNTVTQYYIQASAKTKCPDLHPYHQAMVEGRAYTLSPAQMAEALEVGDKPNLQAIQQAGVDLNGHLFFFTNMGNAIRYNNIAQYEELLALPLSEKNQGIASSRSLQLHVEQDKILSPLTIQFLTNDSRDLLNMIQHGAKKESYAWVIKNLPHLPLPLLKSILEHVEFELKLLAAPTRKEMEKIWIIHVHGKPTKLSAIDRMGLDIAIDELISSQKKSDCTPHLRVIRLKAADLCLQQTTTRAKDLQRR